MVGDGAVDWKVARRRSALSARRLRFASSALRDSVSPRDFARRVASCAGELEAGGEPLVCATGSSRDWIVAGGGGCGDADMGRDSGGWPSGEDGEEEWEEWERAQRTEGAMSGQEVKGGRGAGRGHI